MKTGRSPGSGLGCPALGYSYCCMSHGHSTLTDLCVCVCSCLMEILPKVVFCGGSTVCWCWWTTRECHIYAAVSVHEVACIFSFSLWRISPLLSVLL
uniref:Uncharacterized protein n=1 Tax=Anguilla anguilla TaxID=7936 RepID=A0A0E9XFA9_ANGAN